MSVTPMSPSNSSSVPANQGPPLVNGIPLTPELWQRMRATTTGATVAALLTELGHGADAFVAVAVNRSLVKRSAFGDTQLTASDQVEILSPMAGG